MFVGALFGFFQVESGNSFAGEPGKTEQIGSPRFPRIINPGNAEPQPAVFFEKKEVAVIMISVQDTAPPENAPVKTPSADLGSAEKKSEIQARKIKRSDLTLLPRRFWHLANNSFLLHGYRNYGHLLLLEDEGRLWLGVPGIYDPREARAADLFGFPHFTQDGVSALDLSENECSTNVNFGHWCRCVR